MDNLNVNNLESITAEFSEAFWVDEEHTAFCVTVTLSNGDVYPFTYLVDGSDDNDGIVSVLTRTAFHDGKINIKPPNKELVELKTKDVEREVRDKRTSLLFSTDIYMLSDYPISEEKRNEIKVYRQLLRDVPQQEGFPDNVVWPEKPSI